MAIYGRSWGLTKSTSNYKLQSLVFSVDTGWHLTLLARHLMAVNHNCRSRGAFIYPIRREHSLLHTAASLISPHLAHFAACNQCPLLLGSSEHVDLKWRPLSVEGRASLKKTAASGRSAPLATYAAWSVAAQASQHWSNWGGKHFTASSGINRLSDNWVW